MAKSFKTEFIRHYEEKLEPLGFIKVKGSQPYFVRIVNNEILHVISYRGVHSTKNGLKAIQLVCGVATVYRKEINFSVPPSHNGDWMVTLAIIDEKRETEFPVVNIPRDFKEFFYNDETMGDAIKQSYEGVSIMLDELDRIIDMNAVLKWLIKFDAGNITFASLLDDSFSDEEGLFYARKEFDYGAIDSLFEERYIDLGNSRLNVKEKDMWLNAMRDQEKRMKEAREAFLTVPEVYEKGREVLKKRYLSNVDTLKKYGLNVKL